MERKLATIRKISEIKPIKDADRIELAFIDGWQVVIQKGNFKENDIAIYMEIDSFLPITEPFLFLESKGRKKLEDGTEGYRLRTIKLKKELSQGLLLPLSSFPQLGEVVLGQDVTELLGIKLYEAPVPAQLRGQVRGSFPSYIPKTDEERVQNLIDDKTFNNIKYENLFSISEKIDGTSSTYFISDENEFHVCSRNMDLKDTENNLYWKTAKQYDLENKLRKIKEEKDLHIALQGEIIGTGIQRNPYKLLNTQLFIFNIFNIKNQEYLNTQDNIRLCTELGITHVPIIQDGFSIKEIAIADIIKLADGKSLINPLVNREGIVFKTKINEKIFCGKYSFKSISNNYLLEEE